MSKKIASSRVVEWVFALVLFAASSFLVGKNATDFQASVIPTKQAAPFNGTVTPVQKVPNWVALTSDERKLNYDQLPGSKLVSIPTYDPNQLKMPTEQLSWSKPADIAVRNAKITFSTPYMGDYKLDGLEYAGSHLAIDIKVPNNTPVYAIANGVVVKVSLLSTGFGNHVVVKHENIPSMSDEGVLATYYSSYNHLSSVLISEGDVVTKGQQIGLSGHSGTSSTPHVHFQIDNSQAPWHPYWPFTYQEATAAGLDFDGAINAGLGKEKALATTINPMLYVQKYLNSSGVITTPTVLTTNPTTLNTSTNTSTETQPISSTPETISIEANTLVDRTEETTNTSPNVVPDTQTEKTVSSEETTKPTETVAAPAATSFKVISDEAFVVGKPISLTIQAIDSESKIVSTYKPSSGVNVSIEVGGATISKPYLVPDDFMNGISAVEITATIERGLQIKVSDGNISGESGVLQSSLFSDVATADSSYDAISFLKKHDVIDGYSDGTFKPDKIVSRVEALKFILEGANEKLVRQIPLPFKDTNSNQWYAQYVATGYKNNIVAGYADSTFRPAQTVNRAEFLKMLFQAMDITPHLVTVKPYDDVLPGTWYAPYVKYAKDKNLIVVGSNLFKPEEGMTREEVARVIYRTIMMRLSGQDQYSPGLAVSGNKISEYFNL